MGFSEMDGIGVPEIENWNFSTTLPFFKTKDLDLDGLNDILAHVIKPSSLVKSHLPPGTDSVVTVRSSMKARIVVGGYLTWTWDLCTLALLILQAYS